MKTECLLFCPVCGQEYDWHTGYGRDIRCCCRQCHEEAEWRRALSILGQQYRPQKEKPIVPT